MSKRETHKISCAPEQPKSGLLREIEINVDEESDFVASLTGSSPNRQKETTSARDDTKSVKSKKMKQLKRLKT